MVYAIQTGKSDPITVVSDIVDRAGFWGLQSGAGTNILRAVVGAFVLNMYDMAAAKFK